MSSLLLGLVPNVDEVDDSGYFASWADRVSVTQSFDGIPDHLKTARTEFLADAADLAFSPEYRPPSLPRIPRQPAQSSAYRPSSLADILTPTALRWIDAWAHDCGRDLLRTVAEGPSALRGFHRKLAIGQEYVFPAARGIIWDLRRQKDGVICPLDFDAAPAATLDFSAFADVLASYPDQEAVGFLFDGVQFKVDLSLELLFLPHLLDLPRGTAQSTRGALTTRPDAAE